MDAAKLEQVRSAGRMVFSVQGMWCASCAMALQRALARVKGVRAAQVNFICGAAVLTWHPESIDFAALLQRAAKLGYPLTPSQDQDAAAHALHKQARRIQFRLVVAVFFGMWSMLGCWVLYLDPGLARAPDGLVIAWLALLAALPVIFYCGHDFMRMSIRALRTGLAGMDTLISMGALGALLVSLLNLLRGDSTIYVDASTMLISFLLAGRLLELHARQASGAALQALAQLAPESASRVNAANEEEIVPLSQLQVGQKIRVRAGERIAVDGIVLEGTSLLDGALMSGETMPVQVVPGATVQAGFVNLLSPLLVRVEVLQGARRIDQLGLRMLELFGQRSQLSQSAERFVRWILPLICSLAILSVAHRWWVGEQLLPAIVAGLSMLVSACPCAVGVSVPLAYAIAARRAAANGILWRDPASIEGLASARVIAFDKTGTLTNGTLEIDQVSVAEGQTKEQVLRWAWEAESGVIHPVAEALRRHAVNRHWTLAAATVPVQRLSWGVRMQLPDGQWRLVGARPWLEQEGVTGLPPLPERTGSVHVAQGGLWQGSVSFKDVLRTDTGAVLASLSAQGKKQKLSLWLITGDSAQAAHELDTALNHPFARVLSACSPEDKATAIAGVAQSVFVGDGVNDALVLARAACGIAVPGASQVAVGAAGMVIAEGGLAQLAWARRYARQTCNVVRQNLLFSIIYNAGMVIFLFFHGVTPFAAALAMLASSVSVMLNASRLSWSSRSNQPAG
ncbi:cation-translocating P-type ATPase [Herbaspirillum sp. C7C8]|uniref:heavy metal translocating P-type ATPase n=1 Tax=Herbaspirillum sp. C7C8 TaxID=2736665 RepID=UPI001F524812|nr:cation-translocating P-type ATPase [Herbaspirillum sp. C7C8]MCI1007305.1 cation-translocating P-type ATPase [Herbaspirillum sp. C7C8]